LLSSAFVLLGAPVVRAQLATGSIRVTAPPGTAVRVERAGDAPRAATAGDGGFVLFAHLAPGLHRVAAAGPEKAPVVEVEVGPGEGWLVLLPAGLARRLGGEHVTSFPRERLRGVPRATDPWSVLRDVPGVVVDRVNVGGSETALQSLVVSRGDAGGGTAWSLDGVDVTDPAALGSTAVFPDRDALEGMTVRTGALDARVRTPGAQVALQLRAPSARMSAAAHLRGSGRALQSDNLPAALSDRPFARNRVTSLVEAGAEAGGHATERVWLWGAAARNALAQDTFTEHREELRLTSFAARARARVGDGTTSLLALRSEKVHEDRDTGLSAAAESRWTQSGPAWLMALEDRRALGRVSLLARAAHLDAGFALEAPGGDRDVLDDFRGVTRGSYAAFRTDRPRLQLGLEAAAGTQALGFEHELVAGAGYRRSAVTTEQWWPGSGVRAIERRDVFFRTFQLTGFALPTRAQHARSVHDHAEAYVQDTARRGRLAVTLGLRLDRLAGHNRPSAVDASPLVPTLLPAVSYDGDGTGIRWLDLLPRAGLSWDLTGSGRFTARAGYGAYGAPLGAGDVTFDNPIGREPASLTYYWLDRNGDHAVQAGELDFARGQLGSSGLDPRAPGSTTSPHQVDPGLRAPRTHQALASFEHAAGARFHAGLHASWSRTVRPLWRPVRDLTLADYAIRGAVTGELFGEAYAVGYYAPATESRIVPGNGRRLANREGYRQDAVTVELVAGGRAGPAGWSVWGAFMDWREFFTDTARSLQDPTPLDTEPLQDAGRVAVRPGGLGRGDVFVNARWMAGATVDAALPWRLRATAHLHARDGFPIPYFEVASTGDPTSPAKNVLVSRHLDRYRLPAVAMLDLRMAREVPLGRGSARVVLDVFNALDRATTLQAARDVELPAFGRPREIARPRLVRLGLEYRF
jgi:hypothetical protein